MRKVDPVKHDEKRREILEAAGRCFARDGFRGASIAAICAEAKISPGHLYHYFASKEAIVDAMAVDGLEYAAARFAKMARSADPVASLVSEIGRAKTKYGGAGRLIALDLLVEAARNPVIGALLQKHHRTVRNMLANVLREAQKRGRVDRSLDADLAAAVVISVIDGAKTMTIREPGLNTSQSAALLKTLITRFLTPQKSTGPKRKKRSRAAGRLETTPL